MTASEGSRCDLVDATTTAAVVEQRLPRPISDPTQYGGMSKEVLNRTYMQCEVIGGWAREELTCKSCPQRGKIPCPLVERTKDERDRPDKRLAPGSGPTVTSAAAAGVPEREEPEPRVGTSPSATLDEHFPGHSGAAVDRFDCCHEVDETDSSTDRAPQGQVPDRDVSAVDSKELRIRLDLIDVEPERNPRHSLDIQSMVESQKAVGILQPLVVQPGGQGRYRLLAGHRRLEAARLRGERSVPVLVRHPADEDESRMIVLESNLQFQHLSRAERARSLAEQQAIYLHQHPETAHGAAGGHGKAAAAKSATAEETAPTFAEYAGRLAGMKPRTVSNDIRSWQKATPAVQQAWLGDRITAQVAGKLASRDTTEQAALLAKVDGKQLKEIPVDVRRELGLPIRVRTGQHPDASKGEVDQAAVAELVHEYEHAVSSEAEPGDAALLLVQKIAELVGLSVSRRRKGLAVAKAPRGACVPLTLSRRRGRRRRNATPPLDESGVSPSSQPSFSATAQGPRNP